jgi:hypothetical protein
MKATKLREDVEQIPNPDLSIRPKGPNPDLSTMETDTNNLKEKKLLGGGQLDQT